MPTTFEWLVEFENDDDFKESNVRKDIEENMFMKHSFLSGNSRKKIFVCKYWYKKGWASCLKKYKVSYLPNSMHIVVFVDHNTQVRLGYVPGQYQHSVRVRAPHAL